MLLVTPLVSFLNACQDQAIIEPGAGEFALQATTEVDPAGFAAYPLSLIDGWRDRGIINQGQHIALGRRITQAIALLDKTKPEAAAEVIASLAAQIQSLVADGVIAADEAAPLLAAVDLWALQAVGPPAGELIVLTDINYFSTGGTYEDGLQFGFSVPDNAAFAHNLALNGARPKVVLYRGHNAYEQSSFPWEFYLYPFTYYLDVNTDATVEWRDGEADELVIEDDIASFWMILPQDPVSEIDLTEMLRYAWRGGRLIMIAENSGSVFAVPNANITNVLHAVGSSATVAPGCLRSEALPALSGDPLLVGVTRTVVACASYVNHLASADTPLLVAQVSYPTAARIAITARLPIAPLGMGTRSSATPRVEGDPFTGR